MKRNLFIVMMTAILSVMGTHHALAYDIAVENEGQDYLLQLQQRWDRVDSDLLQ